jgi:4-hydroxybenzoate polyprenyltransferase/phosphoserine phosphatase
MAMNSELTKDVAPSASVWDMDGTLLRTDVFVESVVRLLLRKPWFLFLVPAWLLVGRAFCKRKVAELAADMWTSWPVRDSARLRILTEREHGKPVLLATAAHHIVASQVANEVGLFDGVIASNDVDNLKGKAKLAAIRGWLNEHGCSGFCYAGDSRADFPIWEAADSVVLVSPSASLRRQVAALGKPMDVVDEGGNTLFAVIRAVRPYQWVKNILVFVPMIVGHRLDVATGVLAGLSFVVFSLAASAVYVLNDLSDLDADRQHQKKRSRPFAAGELSVFAGVAILACLLSCASAIALISLPVSFFAVIASYFIANVAYSTFLKQQPVVDVLMLASMYVVRVEAGGVATNVPLSLWLLAFSLFFFASLAFAKRYAELRRVADLGGSLAAGRGYVVADADTLLALGAASGYVAILVLALYMNSDQMQILYGTNRFLWFICPVVMYWITRVWLLARRGVMDEDPILFAFRDRASLAVAAVCVVLFVLASVLR